jgi:hypothetical protein
MSQSPGSDSDEVKWLPFYEPVGRAPRTVATPIWAHVGDEESDDDESNEDGEDPRARSRSPQGRPNMGYNNNHRMRIQVNFPEMADDAALPLMGTVPEPGTMGAGPDELLRYMRTFIPGYHLRGDQIDLTEALVGRSMRVVARKRLELIFMNPNRRHWLLLAIDRLEQAYAYIGSRRMDYRMEAWRKASGIEIHGFKNVTPVLEGQGPEDCGARAAVFGRTFIVTALSGKILNRFPAGNVFNITRERFAAVVERVTRIWERGRVARAEGRE